MRNNLIVGKRTRVESYDPSAAQLAKEAADKAVRDAVEAAKAERLADAPASVNSIPALRAEVNKIKAYLRDL